MAIRLKIQRNRAVSVLGLIAAIALLAVHGHAQVVGATVTGEITDPTGGSIPNAQVSATDTDKGVTTDVKTTSAGFYTIPNLAPGPYQITMRADGFQTEIRSGIVLTVGQQLVVNGTLALGQTSQAVEVTGEQFSVDLASSALSNEVNGTTVRELPLNGRDWTSLANLEPGVIPVYTARAVTDPTAARGPTGFGNEMSVSGHRPNENNFRINGISAVDYANGSPASVLGGALGVDGIQEFSVLTSSYSTEYGRTTGGVINAITKSGTDSLHGTAYWFLRDQKLDARNFFDPATIPPFHRNNFGGALGGPIRKGKTFFFFDYEGIRQDKTLSYSDFVPSPAARAGDLCSIPTGVTPNCTPTTITPSPLVTPFLSLWPLPNAGLIGNGDVGIYDVGGGAEMTENYETIRIDHRFSDTDSLAASSFVDRGDYVNPDALEEVLNESISHHLMVSLEETHVFSPRLINTVRVGYNRALGVATSPVEALDPLASSTSLGALPGRSAPVVTVSSLTQIGGLGSAGDTNLVFNSYQAYDDAFLTEGKHSLKFGFAFERMQINVKATARQSGAFAFPSVQGFLLDQPTSLQITVPGQIEEEGTRQSIFAGYFQDDWRILPNLTLNLGVRYEPTTLPTEAHDQYQGLVNFTGTATPLNTYWQRNATLRNFDPRVGFAWDPFRNGKTSVRGGFGIFDLLPINWLYTSGGTFSSAPFLLQINKSGIPAGSFPTGWVTSVGYSPTGAQYSYIEPDPKRSYAMNWNLNIQREIAPSLTATVGFIGSHTVHQPDSPTNVNGVLPTLTSAGYLYPYPVGSGTLLNPNVGTLRALMWGGSAVYSGLQTQVVKKMSHGIQVQGAFTWSKCIDDGSGGAYGNAYTNSIQSLLWFDKSGRTGPCDFNVGKNFVLNYVWDAPTPKFGGPIVSHVLGGWELSGIFTASTGQPFTMLIAGDPQGMKGQAFAFPDMVAGCNPINQNFKANAMSYVNLNCFTPPVVPSSFPNYATSCQPAAASVAAVLPFTCVNLQGNEGRNTINGPGVTNLNFSMLKNIYLLKNSERFTLQFRAEIFNILNHANFELPADQLNALNANGTVNSTGGRIDSTSTDSREIQFGLKLIW